MVKEKKYRVCIGDEHLGIDKGPAMSKEQAMARAKYLKGSEKGKEWVEENGVPAHAIDVVVRKG